MAVEELDEAGVAPAGDECAFVLELGVEAHCVRRAIAGDVGVGASLIVGRLPAEQGGRIPKGGGLPGLRGMLGKTVQGGFEVADVRSNLAGQEGQDIIGHGRMDSFGLLAENREAGLSVGNLQICGQPKFKTVNEAVNEFVSFMDGTGTGEDDLLFGRMQQEEDLEEFFLEGLPANQNLEVVKDKDVGAQVLLAEFGDCVVLNGRDEFGRELLGGEERYAGTFVSALDVVGYGVQEMRFAETWTAVEEDGIIDLAGLLGDEESDGVGEVVAVARNKGGEGLFRMDHKGVGFCLECKVLWNSGMGACGRGHGKG